MYPPRSTGVMDNQPAKRKRPPAKLREWLEFFWLLLTNPAFRSSRDKRKAYFEHRLGKIYSARCI